MKRGNRFIISILSGAFLLQVFVSPFLFTIEAHASVPTHEWTITGSTPNPLTEAGIAKKELTAAAGGLFSFSTFLSRLIPSWDAIAWIIAKQIVHEFSQSIVRWIRTGQDPFFSGGTSGSLFVTNIDEFVLDAADNAAGIFLEKYLGDAYTNLCTPFRDLVGLGLGTSYGRDYDDFKFQAKCSITDIVANLEDFYADFQNGGWEAWFATSFYENTPFGLLTLSSEFSRQLEQRGANANKLDYNAGLGFPGLRECIKKSPDGTRCEQHITKTPGKAIEDQVANVYGNEIRSLEIADEIDEIIQAAFSQLLSWALSGGDSRGLLGADVDSKRPLQPRGGGGGSPSPAPECSDGLDNDGDGLRDLADSDCTSGSDTTEGVGGGIPPPPVDLPPPPPPGDSVPPPPPPPGP